jgi:formate-dependent phosphoribosylglycinamide formyltransferase (GAR transformylase)
VAATTGYQTRVFADAARSLGCDVVLATDRCHILDDPWGDGAVPVRFERPGSIQAIVNAGPFDAVAAVGDAPAIVAAEAAEALGVRFHRPDAVRAARNKFQARERFRAAGLPVPEYRLIPVDAALSDAAAEQEYPCVLKPVGLSASRGVIRARSAGEFERAFERIRCLLASAELARQPAEIRSHILAEKFIPGGEFALEGLVRGGELQTLAIFDKPDPLNGPFFEETIYVTPSRENEKTQRDITETTQRAVAALGLTDGPVHAEMRVNGRGVWMLEVAARPIGGLCAKALRFEGQPLEQVILRRALGEDVSRLRVDGPASGVYMLPVERAGIYQDVSGAGDAAAVEGIEEIAITAKAGQRLVPLPEGASYLGFIFARADTPQGVEKALREARNCLRFEISLEMPLVR